MVSSKELDILAKRRSHEKKIVSKKDSNYNSQNQEWFIINAEWLKDWKMFVNNKRSTTACGARKSTKKDVGILEPGPVSNLALLDKDKNPLPNLSKGKHYRGVNRSVWQQLYNTYGGGPVLRRNELSIYADEYKEPEDLDVTEIDSTAIKQYFQNNMEEEDSNPMVGDEFEPNEPNTNPVFAARNPQNLQK